MSNDNPMNGHNMDLPTSLPQGDPQVIRVAQHLLQLAQSGAIVGVAVIGVSNEGNAHQSVALPQNATALLLTIGALESVKVNLLDNIKAMQQQTNVSRILKPGMGMQR